MPQRIYIIIGTAGNVYNNMCGCSTCYDAGSVVASIRRSVYSCTIATVAFV